MKQFKELTKAEKRVEIAKDIIQQVKVKTYKPKHFVYLNVIGGKKLGDNYSMQNALLNKEVKCDVCALGAAFCSLVKFDNKLNLQEAKNAGFGGYVPDGGVNARGRLEKYFSERQLALIENAFEKTDFFTRKRRIFGDECERARNYFAVNKCNTPSKLLISIFQNVVDNKGTFKP